MREPIEIVLQPFSIAQISDSINLLKFAWDNGYDLEDLEIFLVNEMQARKETSRTLRMEEDARKAEYISKSPKCPSCGLIMRLIELNSSPANIVPGIGCFWQCPDVLNCGNEVDSKLAYQTELARVGLENTYRPPPNPAFALKSSYEDPSKLRRSRRAITARNKKISRG